MRMMMMMMMMMMEHNMNDSSKKRKKKAAKILRWFPLKPRLQRLFMSSKTAGHMKWHANGRTDDGLMRHPADSPAWKTFDSKYGEFSSEPRNVRLGLAADGFNPFGLMSISHSTWPVILVPYNFPPWMCMKRSSFMLSLLIPGPSSPGNDIDVYLQPLVEELKELWDVGVETYDVSTKTIFQMHAAVMWTINDFPAYGDLSGWNTKGALACPFCNYDTHSSWLYNGGKYCFMGHRRFLDNNHKFRKDAVSFDGSREMRPAPVIPSGQDIIMQTEQVVDFSFGKNNKQKRKRGECAWKKRSIFFTLPYWEHHMLRHNLDVMHVEKNVTDNIMGTLLNVAKKTKDNLKARFDLQDMGIRSELHPEECGNDKWSMPHACFTMTTSEKYSFLEVLEGVRVPDGYASNVSRCVKLKERKIIGTYHDLSLMCVIELIQKALLQKGAMLSITLDQKSMTQAHRYVLFNCDEIIPFRNVHKDRIKAQLHPRRVSDDQIHKIHMEKFCDWFREHVVLMTDAENEKLTHIVRCLARGPNNEARRLKRYVTNGLKFRTKDSEEDKKTQNSGHLKLHKCSMWKIKDIKIGLLAVKTKARDIFDAGIGVLCDDEDDESNTYCENVPYNALLHNKPQLTSPKQAHHESLDVEEQLAVDAAVSGAPLKRATRGRSKYLHIWNLAPGTKVELPLNHENQPVGKEGRTFTGGDSSYLKTRGTFLAVKEWTLQKLSKMWRDRKWRMKGRKFKKNGNPTHVVAAASPHVDKVDFATLVTYWYSKDGQDLSDKNKKSCSFQKETHTAGSKSYASHVEEMKEERGVNVPIERAELYEKFYTHKDGTPVNDNAAKNIQTMNELMSDPSTQLDCTSSSGSIAWAPNDVYSQVKGSEHSGRVRGLGFGPTPSGRNTKTKIMGLRIRSVEEDPKYQEMKNELDSLKAQVANMAQFLQQNAQHFPQGNFGVPDQQSPIGQRSSVASHQSENLREF
uniref:DUF4218 domain-containing protein n=1 Tax=Fagus sylvatica TaxID=28930 RepID=A0A2N9G202_FAGSY